MNERIRQLAEQAGNHADTYDDANGPIWFQMYNEKFAELIVRECICALDDADGSVHHSECLLERFGVEE